MLTPHDLKPRCLRCGRPAGSYVTAKGPVCDACVKRKPTPRERVWTLVTNRQVVPVALAVLFAMLVAALLLHENARP